MFPGPVVRVFNSLYFLGGEGEVGAVRGEVGVESAALSDNVVERLVAVQDLAVLLGVELPLLVLGALVGLVVVADLVH